MNINPIKYKGLFYIIRRRFHLLKCRYYNWYLLKLKKKGLLEKKYHWEKWDQQLELYLCRKQHRLIAWSLKDFRFYMYIRKCNEGWL